MTDIIHCLKCDDTYPEKQQVVSETHSPKIRVQSISPPGTAGRMTTKNMTSTTNSING